MSTSSQGWICYEQPLSERVRTMLRLEHLFKRAAIALPADETWSSRITVDSLIDIMAVLGRADLKKDLIKELERHALTLESLARNPNVDPERLAAVRTTVSDLLSRLKNSEIGFGHGLRRNELFSAVRQRSSIPAGTCDFDLPNYHFWLSLPAERRQADLRAWVSSFDLLREAVTLCLKLVRESGVTTDEVAPGGFFQRTLETTTPCQLVRVSLPRESECFPEISAGRHRFTIRFMRQTDLGERPTQMQADTKFSLVCCVI